MTASERQVPQGLSARQRDRQTGRHIYYLQMDRQLGGQARKAIEIHVDRQSGRQCEQIRRLLIIYKSRKYWLHVNNILGSVVSVDNHKPGCLGFVTTSLPH